MRKTLLMLLAVLVCCSSLFVVAGCGPKYVDHPHVGVGECESCGANYYDLMRDMVKEKGEKSESTHSYKIMCDLEESKSIVIRYDYEDQDIEIAYYILDYPDISLSFTIYMTRESDGVYKWTYSDTTDLYNPDLDSGSVVAMNFTSSSRLYGYNILYGNLYALLLQNLLYAFDDISAQFGLNLTYENLGFTNF